MNNGNDELSDAVRVNRLFGKVPRFKIKLECVTGFQVENLETLLFTQNSRLHV